MFFMIPSQVFSHILYVKKLRIVILYHLGHTGLITLLWTPFFYLLQLFTPLLALCRQHWRCESLPCNVKSNIPTVWTKDDTNMQVTPSIVWSNFYYPQISRPPTFELWIWCQKLGLYVSIYGNSCGPINESLSLSLSSISSSWQYIYIHIYKCFP